MNKKNFLATKYDIQSFKIVFKVCLFTKRVRDKHTPSDLRVGR
jgi:hypothetical protein